MILRTILFITFGFIYSSFLFCNENVSFSLPKEDWGVTVDLSGFSVSGNSFGTDGRERNVTIQAGEKISGTLNISLSDESPAECCNNFINCFEAQSNNVVYVNQSELDDISYVYYDIEMPDGELFKGFACFTGSEGRNAEISLLAKENASSFLPASQRILMSFKIAENYQPPINERLVLGKYYFDNQDFFSALEVFDLLLKNPLLQKVLSDDDYRTFVNISSSAYNVVGLPELGIKLLNEGICRLPEDSTFYYNLASIYALYGMEDKVISNLEKAYRFQAKNLNFAYLPNPFQDSAFQTFLMNSHNYEEVRNLVKWFASP